MRTRLALAVLLAFQASLLGWIGWSTSPNSIEVGHMGATVYFWNTIRFDVFHVNPPLTRIVSGLPVVVTGPEYNWDAYSQRPEDRSELWIGRSFVEANDPGKLRWCFVLARWSLIPILLLGGYFGYRLSLKIFGPGAAWVFLILWCFSPLLLGLGATICPDAVAAALGVVALYALHRWLHRPGWPRAVVAGICLGLLPLSKLTWIVAFALWPLIWGCWALLNRWKRLESRHLPTPPFRELLMVVLLGLYMLNMGYLFDGTMRPLGDYRFNSHALAGGEHSGDAGGPDARNRFAGSWLGRIPIPLPAEFVQGMDTQRCDFERGRPSYLGGQWSEHGWWYFYLYVMAVKMPLGTWGLLILALLTTAFSKNYRAALQDELLILLPMLTIFAVVSSQTGFSLHSRYVLPALPLLLLWISKVGRAFSFENRIVATLVALSLGWMILSSLIVYPHSLSYFNELAGGPKNGPEHLLGSNIDWGQDLFTLQTWYEHHPEARPICIAYDGMYPLEKTSIESAGTPPVGVDPGEIAVGREDLINECGPQPGWFALSVNEIYAESQRYRYFLEFEPTAMAGYSIYIYHITIADANRARRKLQLPELPVN